VTFATATTLSRHCSCGVVPSVPRGTAGTNGCILHVELYLQLSDTASGFW
jgi:hypothetical protein